MEEKNERKRISWKYIGFILAAGISLGVLFSFLEVDLSFMEGLSFWHFPLMLLLFYIGVFLVINIHELGHLVFGKLLGYRFLLFRAGPLSIQKENEKLKVTFIKNVGYGGLCAMLPGENSHLGHFAIYSTGGIFFNILTGVGFIISFFRISQPVFTAVPLFLTGVVSILLALLNAWPFFSMNQPTDGMMFFSILRKNPLAERFYESAMLSKKLSLGVRPKDLGLHPVKLPLEDFHELTTVFYLYFMEMDRGEMDKAGEYLKVVEENLSKVPPYSLPAYYYELIFYYLITGDTRRAQYYHEKAGKILEKDRDINGLRIKSYYAFYAMEDPVKAKELALEGISVMEKFPFRGQALFEAEQLEKLISRIDSP
ncbi:M50 family metallopeptidase [Proteiniclasticum sp. C24MP]|uniref:M50 family metallopeptidase n=1 Tax=Proteiniclasticum sp. C24MP TaxID=3374101 RepID=UPI0037548B90